MQDASLKDLGVTAGKGIDGRLRDDVCHVPKALAPSSRVTREAHIRECSKAAEEDAHVFLVGRVRQVAHKEATRLTEGGEGSVTTIIITTAPLPLLPPLNTPLSFYCLCFCTGGMSL